MYLNSIEIENVGPIELLKIDFPFVEGRPKPVVIVGENGTGKSILLSHIVNALIVGKQELYDDVEVESGKVYKYRSPSYITSGKDYFYSSIKFQAGVEVQEMQLNLKKEAFEQTYSYTPAKQIWTKIPSTETSVFTATFSNHTEETSTLFSKQCCLYFPVNRFEEPAWLNITNLKSQASYTERRALARQSNRNLINVSPLKQNRDWLLDLLLDRQLYELRTHSTHMHPAPGAPAIPVQVFDGFSGQSSQIYAAILRVVKILMAEPGNIRLGVGPRRSRQISVMKDERTWVPNLFQLSTGEVQLLNLFLSIVRDFDLSESELNNLIDIKGIVIIDEIDVHLHTTHQKEVLPQLISLFPNVQFVITTHSPLFLMGMEARFGADGFTVLNMPRGELVAATDFSEFNAAYEAFKETTRHREEIRQELEQHAKPIVFVEGDYDVRYITKAAQLLNRIDLLDRIQLKEGGGFGNLEKIWKGYDNPISEVVPNKIILLFDCDTKKQNGERGKVFKRVIPTAENNPITIGIENLFPIETITQIENQFPQYIDIQEGSTKRVRGVLVNTPATKSVNKDEKGNMCDWICEHGRAADFAQFDSLFRVIVEILNS